MTTLTVDGRTITVANIDSMGILINEDENAPTANPWECHYFKNNILYNNNDEEYYRYEKDVRWYAEGALPLDLTIEDGIIFGNIAPLTKDQPSVTEFYPKEKIKEDGSNYLHTGRYKNATHLFNFTICRDYHILIINPQTNEVILSNSDDYIIEDDVLKLTDGTILLDSIEELVIEDDEPLRILHTIKSSLCSIMVIKNNNIDNLIFCKAYLESDHVLCIGKTKYDENTEEDFLRNHPGPFQNCNKE